MRIPGINLALIIGGIGLLAGCVEELPPRSAADFIDNPIMLEAAMVRCSQDRAATRYDAECVNARQAVRRIEAKEEALRKVEFDARSKSKRQALRRAQEAAAQARRRAAEAERRREEAAYLAQFGVVPPRDDGFSSDDSSIDNTPQAAIPDSEPQQESQSGPGDILPATDGGNAPVMTVEPEKPEAPATDLESIRNELQRRNEDGNQSGD